ncbi:hypothetical protein D3C77_525480 [compost metagenome]
MAVNDTAGLAAFVEHRQGVEVGLAAEQLQHLRGWCVLVHRRLLVEQGGEIAAVFAEHLDIPVGAAQHLLDVP